MACSTFARVASATLGEWLITRDTVWWLTPASFATSKMEGRFAPLCPAIATSAREHITNCIQEIL